VSFVFQRFSLNKKCNNPKIPSLILPYLEGELNKQETSLVEEHIRECPTCGRELKELETLILQLKGNPEAFCPSPEEIVLYARGAMGPKSEKAGLIEEHLRICPLCQEEVALIKEVGVEFAGRMRASHKPGARRVFVLLPPQANLRKRRILRFPVAAASQPAPYSLKRPPLPVESKDGKLKGYFNLDPENRAYLSLTKVPSTFQGKRFSISIPDLGIEAQGLKIQQGRIMLGKLDQGDKVDFSRIKEVRLIVEDG